MSPDDVRRLEASVDKLFEKLDMLAEGHNEIKSQISEFKSDWRHAVVKADEAHKMIFGNGEPEKGLATRVPKLEESEKTRKWLTAAVIVALITAVVRAAVEAFA